jgi:aminobenzoyl-glutamate utilization protein B
MRHRLSAFAIAALAPSAAAAAPLPAAQTSAILELARGDQANMTAAARDLWNYAELGFHETRSSARLQQQLRAAGFKVEGGVAGMPTAFVATAGHGHPVIAILAEFDALPGLAQTTAPKPSPIAGQPAGHACGHNLLGAASVSAAIVLKRWMETNKVAGEVRVYGSPAEEGGFGKVYMVRQGLFDDVDVTLAWHPADENAAVAAQTLAWIAGKFRFTGIAAHAAIAPDRGRSALDAVEIMDVAANFMREHVPPDTRIQYVITDGGGQPNVVPAHATSFYYVRNFDPAIARDVWSRLELAAKGATLATGTTVETEIIGAAYSTLPNNTLGELVDRELRVAGGVDYTPDEAAYARALTATIPGAAPKDPTKVQPYRFGVKIPASSDVGDVSWITPTGAFSTATWPAGVVQHTWQAAAASGASLGFKGAEMAVRTLALTGAELLTNPNLVARARAEFTERRGADFHYAALLGDRAPPLDYAGRN